MFEDAEKHRQRSRAYYYKNRDRVLAQSKLRKRSKYNPALARTRKLITTYGLTVGEFEVIRQTQQNRCRICGETFVKQPHVDHDHSTGRVRGLLCTRCNCGLGQFRDNVDSLQSAITYLKS